MSSLARPSFTGSTSPASGPLLDLLQGRQGRAGRQGLRTRQGERLGDRVVRPARVAVVEPTGSTDVPLDPTSLGDTVDRDDENTDEGQ